MGINCVGSHRHMKNSPYFPWGMWYMSFMSITHVRQAFGFVLYSTTIQGYMSVAIPSPNNFHSNGFWPILLTHNQISSFLSAKIWWPPHAFRLACHGLCLERWISFLMPLTFLVSGTLSIFSTHFRWKRRKGTLSIGYKVILKKASRTNIRFKIQ